MNKLIIAALAGTMAFAVPAFAQDIHHSDYNEMRDAQNGRGDSMRHEERQEEHHEQRAAAHHERHARHHARHHKKMHERREEMHRDAQ